MAQDLIRVLVGTPPVGFEVLEYSAKLLVALMVLDYIFSLVALPLSIFNKFKK